MNRMLHIRAEKGWINDPNGLCFFKGYYHVFFQCNPYGLEWAKMHWAHVRSRNLLDWEYCPLALVPEIECERGEKGGCFSGSAIEKDGLLYLVYTASDGLHQKVCVAYSQDGMEFKKYVQATEIPQILNSSGIILILTEYKKASSPKGIMTTKLFEAMAVEKPILCIPSDESFLKEKIEQTKTGLAARNVDEVTSFILKYYNQWKEKGSTSITPNHNEIEKFSRKGQARQFSEIFKKAINQN